MHATVPSESLFDLPLMPPSGQMLESPAGAFQSQAGQASHILRPIWVPGEWQGQAAPCDFFNSRGMLLLRAGAEITPRLTLDASQLRQAGASQPRVFCRDYQAQLISDFNPLESLQEIGLMLAYLDERLMRHEHVSAQELIRLACDLHALWSLDADACLGYVRLHKFGRPSVCHSLHVALLAAELAAVHGQGRQQIIDVMGVALSMNLAQLALHDDLHDSARQPDEQQRHDIHEHPLASAQLLEHLGRFPRVWLEGVAAHHENVDGSGYPGSLQGADIPLVARMVRVADTFAARLTWRRVRQPLHWNLRRTDSASSLAHHIFGKDLQRLDAPLITQLVRVLGRFPPGSLVRLNSGELAVTTRRPAATDPLPGEAYAIRDIHGRILAAPQRRPLGHGLYEIRNYANEECRRFLHYDWQALWGYAYD